MTLDERHTALLQQVEDYMQATPDVQDDELAPSLLVIAVQPRAPRPNGRARLIGNPDHVAGVLAQMLDEEHHRVFLDALADAMDAVDKRKGRAVVPVGKPITD